MAADLSESDLKREFVQRVTSREIEGIKVIYTASGGAPGEYLYEEAVISGADDMNMILKVKDESRSQPLQEFSTKVDRGTIQSLFKNIGVGIDSLVSAEKAAFLPDSLVGSITFEVDGKKSDTYYFLVDEDDRLSQGKPISSEVTEAIKEIREISKRFR